MPFDDDPISDDETVQSLLRKWIDRSLRPRVRGCWAGRVKWTPSADIHETEGAYHVFMDMAGVEPSGIRLLIEGDTVRISGERERPRAEMCIRIHQLEIDSGCFERSFQLASRLDPDGAKFVYENGILQIILPKSRL